MSLPERLRAALVEVAHAFLEAFEDRPEPPPELTPLQQQILDALTDQPRPAKSIAREIEHRYDSYFRRQLAALVDQGHAVHVTGGYRRAELRPEQS